jgi:hypothetical protein
VLPLYHILLGQLVSPRVKNFTLSPGQTRVLDVLKLEHSGADAGQ